MSIPSKFGLENPTRFQPLECQLLTFILGFGAMVFVGQDDIKKIDAGGNMAAPMLAEVLGGDALLGFIAAVSFATILAVVAGLTLSGAAALSHDLWLNVIRSGMANESEQLLVARGATVLLGGSAIALGIVFKGQNVAYIVGLAFALAKRFPLGTSQLVPISPPCYSRCFGGVSPPREQ